MTAAPLLAAGQQRIKSEFDPLVDSYIFSCCLFSPFFFISVSNSKTIENDSERKVQFTLTSATHPEDGLVTSTLIVPTFACLYGLSQLGKFEAFAKSAMDDTPEVQTLVFGVPATGSEWLGALYDCAQTVAISAGLTIGIAGLNHLLCRKLHAYRRANAAITTAIDFAPKTTLASTVAFGLFGAVLIGERGVSLRPLSTFTMFFILHWSVSTVMLTSIAGRFVGHTLAAAWFGMDKLTLTVDK